eukprot:scaffold8290_cov62-Phaeocystis_antarctica.AAC.5
MPGSNRSKGFAVQQTCTPSNPFWPDSARGSAGHPKALAMAANCHSGLLALAISSHRIFTPTRVNGQCFCCAPRDYTCDGSASVVCCPGLRLGATHLVALDAWYVEPAEHLFQRLGLILQLIGLTASGTAVAAGAGRVVMVVEVALHGGKCGCARCAHQS